MLINDLGARLNNVRIVLGREPANSGDILWQEYVIAAKDGQPIFAGELDRALKVGVDAHVAFVAQVVDACIRKATNPLLWLGRRVGVIDDRQPPVGIALRPNALNGGLEQIYVAPVRHHNFYRHSLYDDTVRRTSFADQAVYSVIGIGLTGVSRFAYTVVIGRILGADMLAAVSAALALTTIVSSIWPTGLGASGAHHVATKLSQGQSFQRLVRHLEMSFLASAAAIVLVTIGYSALSFHETAVFFAAVVVLAVSYSGYILARSLQLAVGQARRAAAWDAINAAISLLGLMIVLLLRQPQFVLWPMALGFVVFMVQALVDLRGRAQIGTAEVAVPGKAIAITTIWNSVSLLTSNGLIQFSMLIVFVAEPHASSGLFAAAMSLATPAAMLSQALSQVLIPRISAWRVTEADHGRRQYARIFWALGALFTVVFGAVIALAPLVVAVFYGKNFADAVGMLIILLAGMWAFSIGIVATACLLAHRRERLVALVSASSFVIGFVTILLSAGPFGWGLASAMGVALGYAVGGFVLSLASWRIVRDVPQRGEQ